MCTFFSFKVYGLGCEQDYRRERVVSKDNGGDCPWDHT